MFAMLPVTRNYHNVFPEGALCLHLLVSCLVVVLFIDFTYTTFSLRQRDVKTDAIVVLDRWQRDGSKRGYAFTGNIARWLYLMGVDPSVRKGDLFKEQRRGGEEMFWRSRPEIPWKMPCTPVILLPVKKSDPSGSLPHAIT